MYQIIQDRNQWDACWADSGLDTVFCTWNFSKLFLPRSSLFVCREKFKLALVIISQFGQAVTSLHYGGILTNSQDKPFCREVVKSLRGYLSSLGIKNCYLRSHPFLDTIEIGQLVKEDPLIFIDLTRPENELVSAITKQHLRCAFRAKEKGLEVTLTDRLEYLEVFYEFYKACQIKSGNQYREYVFFQRMLVLLKKNLIFSVVRDDKKLVAVSILLKDLGHVYMTYGGMSDDGYKNCAKHLMIFELIRRFKINGFSKLILGTGCDGKDSIYRFKRGFTDREHQVRTFKV